VPEQVQAELANRYRIERELGRGGMATVYLAQDFRHERLVALKVLDREVGALLGAERFGREIKTAARLHHPHILQLYDSGEAAGHLYYVMPYVAGESLRDRLKRDGALPLEDTLRITREVADALDYAHRHGFVHRDVKPENILLADSHALLADFGIAKAADAAGAGLTQTGLLVGTPAYMSPDQASGGAVDGRSDQYSLACVVFEMLAAEPLFSGETPQAIIAQRFRDTAPPLDRLPPTVPEHVAGTLGKALAPEPGQRFPSVAEFARALSEPGASRPISATISSRGKKLSPSAQRRSRGVTLFAAVLLAVLLVVVVWQRSHGGIPSSGDRSAANRLAVLPFENLGDSADAYFADGVTDAVRDKLAALPGLEVIASTSTNQYRHTTKRPDEIGRELGARYLLVGNVRWAKAGAGSSRVQVHPELVDARTGAERWGEPFDAPLTDVFQVQAEIAGQVAEALHVALGATDRQVLGAKPTADSAAYDAYLRGNVYAERGVAEPDLQEAKRLYEQAVALDPTFALAYARLSRTHDNLYWFYYDRTEARLAQAKVAADRALRLRPDLAEAHQALGYYYYHGRLDYERALKEFETARKLQPSNAEVYTALGSVHRRQAKWAEALTDFRRAVELNPRSAIDFDELAITESFLRSYDDAEQHLVRALEIGQDQWRAYAWRSLVDVLRNGDTAAAQHVVREALGTAGPERILLGMFRAQEAVSAVSSAVFDTALAHVPFRTFGNDTAAYYAWKAGFHQYQRHPDTARAYLDSARAVLEARTAQQPDDPRPHALLGMVYAELGRQAEAQRQGEHAVALRPVSQDAVDGTMYRLMLARILAKVGETDAAVDQLGYLLSVPAAVSIPLLRVEHTWDPLRTNPRFERLVNGS
jgi:serine/threonine protein kinase/tetratricopeptide (TPR) repeat protein